ncbi:hypothetical protein V6N12_017135 [Hibiscus sabdariffa]|uniref:Isopenicillin N synthase-like Fe(2+) 2OG dioxygenase domain-containing protein n=1 Tax=Hibiscus sabdariffa TaxID=183260 RepID=A0ABR2BBW4_9ROSI
MATAVNVSGEKHYDRAAEIKRFDESKMGVKGLVDSGLTTIPPIFIHPTDTLSDLKTKPQSVVVPTIDLSGPRSTVVEQVAAASRTFGDTLQIKLGRRLPKLEDIPEVIRDEVVQWNLYSETLGEQLMGLLSEGLGLDMDRLKNTCLDAKLMILSNDEYISVEHRVLANPSKEARVSVAVFFNPSAREALHGPFSELISPEKPPRYRQFAHHDYMTRFYTKRLEGKTLIDYYRI